jgi:hypothetical protein
LASWFSYFDSDQPIAYRALTVYSLHVARDLFWAGKPYSPKYTKGHRLPGSDPPISIKKALRTTIESTLDRVKGCPNPTTCLPEAQDLLKGLIGFVYRRMRWIDARLRSIDEDRPMHNDLQRRAYEYCRFIKAPKPWEEIQPKVDEWMQCIETKAKELNLVIPEDGFDVPHVPNCHVIRGDRKKTGKRWEFCFNGQIEKLTHYAGFDVIALLLDRKGEDLLRYEVNALLAKQGKGKNYHETITLQDIYGANDRKSIEEGISMLESCRARETDPERRVEIQEKIDEARKCLNNATKKGTKGTLPKSRTFGSARAMIKNHEKAMEHINMDFPTL